ncbi:hypothetical protein [Chitiniphilus eburneus]|uniref:Uncharacterized protein n=1 Tax=Chitiniphilus eburneus TaxID=2571148 RepID=A0A4U0PYP8_9NEIS|nr:hypothetical protein [Chitiniphilus eburneus]TJZ73776.1 hypothetical protein FAZ21_09135 [Chitiniphilus eburneus]
MTRPWFPFYPADWQANANLRRCTPAERAYWLDVMCLMHDSAQYGVLPWPLKEIAQAINCRAADLRTLVNKGVLKGADAGQRVPELIYTPVSGRKPGPPVVLIESRMGPLWYSSRMVIDEHKRLTRGGTKDAPDNTPDDAPKPPFGEGFDATPEGTPHPSPLVRAGVRSQKEQKQQPKTSGGSSSSVALNHSAATTDTQPEALRIARHLRERGAAVVPANPELHAWVRDGISDTQISQAMDIAANARQAKASTQPITAGYLDSILRNTVLPQARGATQPASGKAPAFDPVAYANRNRMPPEESGHVVDADYQRLA